MTHQPLGTQNAIKIKFSVLYLPSAGSALTPFAFLFSRMAAHPRVYRLFQPQDLQPYVLCLNS